MEFPGLLEKTVVPERNTILQTAALQHRITAAPKVALKRYSAVKRTLEWSKILFSEQKGIWATHPEALKRGDKGVLKKVRKLPVCLY